LENQHEIPVTNSFNIAADINIRDEGLAESLKKSAMGEATQQEKIEMIQALIGRDVKVSYKEERGSSYSYRTDDIALGQESLTWLLGVSKDNLPPNIPEAFTPELSAHLTALHESEHATQYVGKRDSVTGNAIGRIESFTISDRPIIEYGLAEEIIKEADSDHVIMQHLDDLELPEVKEFYLDARMTRSFVTQFLSSRDESHEHDTASLLRHFEETGEVIDVDHFVEEKRALMEKINNEFGFGVDEYFNVFMDYEIDSRRLSEDQGQYQLDLAVKPQQLMHAVQSLLDKGELDGVQKWEAENFMSSMERLGYEPDGNYTIEAQIRDVLHNKMGFPFKDPQNNEPEMGVGAEMKLGGS